MGPAWDPWRERSSTVSDTEEPKNEHVRDETLCVYEWRLKCLNDAGVSGVEATILAENTSVDLHQACDLAKSDCSPLHLVAILT
jgi:hypothetical protein